MLHGRNKEFIKFLPEMEQAVATTQQYVLDCISQNRKDIEINL